MLASNHKRILRNTAMLYMRMLLAMAVGLYTSRVVLEVLGIEDFGTYHVVAGFVALLGFMQGAMTTATQRYFAFDLGQNEGSNLRSLFNTSLQIHALMAMCIALLAETAGYWFVSTQLTIPPDRLDAALTAYHLSIAAFAVSVMTVPLTAMLMANERMGLFALMSMTDVLLKLVAVLLLSYLASDKLSTYAALLLGVALISFSGYLLINHTLFPAVRLQWGWDGERFRSMLGFTAWSTWGNLAAAMSGHGNNVLLNIFFGPAVNAGRSIASQANGALNQFVSNVQAAINPQIIKQYAAGQHQQMHELVQKASKYNFFLLLTLAMPVLLYTEQLLGIWLAAPPEYAAVFLRLTIIASLIESLSRPMMTLAQATGKIRLYQTVVGGLLLCNVPLSFLALTIWQKPTLVLWTSIIFEATALFARLIILRRLTGMAVVRYLKLTISRVIMVSSTAGTINYLMVFESASGLTLFLGLLINVTSTIITIYLLGLDNLEKKYLSKITTKSCRKFFNFSTN
ncbi:lipopolysaccharide biosynthesis protein [Pseudomonas sp. A-1]|uniref:lipopolysaccharide biosynthesis protein n=1 Tax=Pseudomonas sp. A-1 TaxID=1821274 RepID=UPI0010A622DA|nr:lipopolysaccharide biosynthesis protein [Pseudomonas sp. A-1]THG87300.1 lipopolysaccharide biosynthesis protein [Pseudomonas sp. A-1]